MGRVFEEKSSEKSHRPSWPLEDAIGGGLLASTNGAATLPSSAQPRSSATLLSGGFLQLPTIFRSRRFGPEGRSGAQSGAGWVAGSWGWMFRRCPRHYRFPSQHRPSVGRRSCGTCTSPPACLLPPTPPAIGHQEGELGQLGEVLTKVVRKHGEISRVRLMCISRDWKAALESVDNVGPLQILLCTITVLVCSSDPPPICITPIEQIVVENVENVPAIHVFRKNEFKPKTAVIKTKEYCKLEKSHGLALLNLLRRQKSEMFYL